MEEKIEQSLDKILEWAEAGEGFVIEQAPLVAQEFVAWWFWSHAAGAVMSLVVLLAMAWGCWWAFRRIDEDRNEPPMEVIPAIFCPIIGAVSALILIVNVFEATKAAVAPRLVVIDYLSNLL